MSGTIPNLWPEFNVDVLTPVAILRTQAELLSKNTRGILVGEVETEEAEGRVQHRLVVVAPAYNSYRHTLLTVSHDDALPYPVLVKALSLLVRTDFDEGEVYPEAADDEELIKLVGRALRSDDTRSTIISLIAKSNDTPSKK